MMDAGGRKRFIGETMNEAIGAMRETLGRDALLISSNKVRSGGVFGMGGRDHYEVVGESRPYPRETAGGRGRRNARREATRPSAAAIDEILAAADKERGRRRPTRWESSEAIQLELPFADEALLARESAGLYGRTGRGRGGAGPRRAAALPKSALPGAAPRRAADDTFDSHLLSDPRTRQSAGRDDLASLRDEIASLKDEFRAALAGRPAVETAPAPGGALFGGASAFENLAPVTMAGDAVTDPARIPPLADGLRRRMLESGLPAELAEKITRAVVARSSVAELEDAAIMRARFRKEAASLIAIAAPLEPLQDRPLIIFAIGPTGVGKTTTLAKLGAIFSEEESRRIAFITIDHYRIAAVEQLRTYSEILGAPFELATAVDELKDAIGRHMDKDVILVDTAGRSPFAVEGIEEVRRLREEIGIESEALLFVSSTTSLAQMETVIERFRPSDAARLVFTKVDETSQWGPLFAAAVRSALPVAYATNGQSVPFDIEPARAVRFAEAILGEKAER
jgi:flagellar biosynthesis protein FlhF